MEQIRITKRRSRQRVEETVETPAPAAGPDTSDAAELVERIDALLAA